jgi:hypothetical protein
MNLIDKFKAFGTQRLITLLKASVQAERTSLIEVLAPLAEFDRRQAYAKEGYSSTYAFCTKCLKYSEQAAYLRIRAARTARRYPVAFSYIKEGALSLTAISLVATHLDAGNAETLLERIKFKSRLEIEALLAELGPRPAPRDMIRIDGVWSSRPKDKAAESTKAPLPLRVRIAFSADEPMVRDIERAKQMLFHKYPDGALAHIFSDALGILLNKADPDRRLLLKKASTRPKSRRPTTRRIPQWVKDKVWTRDSGRCRYINNRGGRCDEKAGLEYDHMIPFALGGKSDEPSNIRLLCGTHNNMHTQFDGGRA